MAGGVDGGVGGDTIGRTKAERDTQFHRSPATVISVLSLAVSIAVGVITVRTFTVTQRPYIGVVEAKVELDSPGIPTTFRYQLFIRNAGALFGTTDDTDPATGHPREFIALHLSTQRQRFEWLNLDDADPSAALEGLGGRFGLTKGR